MKKDNAYLSSFIAIWSGSVSPSSSTITGAHILHTQPTAKCQHFLRVQINNQVIQQASKLQIFTDRPTPLNLWSYMLIVQKHACFISTTPVYCCLHQYTSCCCLETSTWSSTENLVPAGGRRHWFIYQCLTIHKLGPLIVEIAMILSWLSIAVSE